MGQGTEVGFRRWRRQGLAWMARRFPGWVRRKARLWELPVDRYEVRLARSADELTEAFRLARECYVARGIVPPESPLLRMTPQHALSEAQVFVAVERDRIVGTLTATLDTDAGLPMDKELHSELNALRSEGARAAELNTLAVAPGNRGSGVTKLLFLAAHWHARNNMGATHVVMQVSADVEPLYMALFGFSRLGLVEAHMEYGVSVAGLVHCVKDAKAFFQRHHREHGPDGPSAHYHFAVCPPACVQLPTIWETDAQTWGLPRPVFQEMFIRRSRHLDNLDTRTFDCVRDQRSEETLNVPV